MDYSAEASPQRQHSELNQWPVYGAVSHRVKLCKSKKEGVEESTNGFS